MDIFLYIIVSLVVLSIGGWFGYNSYKDYYKAKANLHLRNNLKSIEEYFNRRDHSLYRETYNGEIYYGVYYGEDEINPMRIRKVDTVVFYKLIKCLESKTLTFDEFLEDLNSNGRYMLHDESRSEGTP